MDLPGLDIYWDSVHTEIKTCIYNTLLKRLQNGRFLSTLLKLPHSLYFYKSQLWQKQCIANISGWIHTQSSRSSLDRVQKRLRRLMGDEPFAFYNTFLSGEALLAAP